jgi:two-component system, response regulator YesN
MLKVMLVDDERPVIEMLKGLVDWESLGFEVCGEAGDGEEACELERGLRPDLVIADINMPYMSGLELASRLRRGELSPRVVMLTGYGEFEYARAAVNAGVFYYMMKPVDREELERVLAKAAGEIARERDRDSGVRDLRAKAEASERLLRDRYLSDLVTGRSGDSGKEAKSKLAGYGIAFASERFTVAVVELDRLSELCLSEEARWRAVEGVMDAVRRSFHVPGSFVVFPDASHRAVIVASEPARTDRRATSYSIACKKVRMELEELEGRSVTIGYGSCHAGFESLYSSWSEAMSALRYKFLLGSSRVLAFDSIELSDQRELYCSEGTRTEILSRLRAGDLPGIEALVRELFSPTRLRSASPEYAQMVCAELVLAGVSFLSESEIRASEVLGADVQPMEEFRKAETLDEAELWVLRFYAAAIDRQRRSRVPASDRIVERAAKLIEASLDNPELGVTMVAREIHVNEDYLSSLFKRRHGLPLVKYIARRRMEKARDLMDGGASNMAYVAEAVGFEDQNYFGKCFKKHFGVAPSVYSERGR